MRRDATLVAVTRTVRSSPARPATRPQAPAPARPTSEVSTGRERHIPMSLRQAIYCLTSQPTVDMKYHTLAFLKRDKDFTATLIQFLQYFSYDILGYFTLWLCI